MKIDRRVTNGLAWAGVLLVVGVPTADLLSAQFMGDTAQVVAPVQVASVERIAPIPAPLSQRPAAPVTQVAAVAPAKPAAPVVIAEPVEQVAVVAPARPATPTAATPASQNGGAVDAWVSSGKPLPSYITGGAQPAQVAATPPVRQPILTAPATQSPATQPAAIDPVQVASIAQPKTAPVPMPLSMRPQPITATPVAVVRPSGLVVAPNAVGPLPPADVTAADLEDWESGPLSEFLAQRQAQSGQVQADPNYDDDGFFFDEGPNGQPRRRDRLIGPANTYFFPFVN
ncbi:hypothetical protein [Devosia sp. SL43]|uniref:hypothetical protein n=1 Tax=Devosia sp. SL43 TaxID=2806348 RepID=UPI001F36D3DD|nr:hypothetical protein [Devosia sp. SL43]UJW86761.1 hypothetical protein IM737_05785 [Devosia sp. SL43]